MTRIMTLREENRSDSFANVMAACIDTWVTLRHGNIVLRTLRMSHGFHDLLTVVC